MNIPLSVTPIVKYNSEKFSIWFDKQQRIIDAPIKPYFYSYQKLDIDADVTEVEAIALSCYQKKKFYKYSFRTRQELVDCRDKIRDVQGHGITFEDNIPFVLRNRIDFPELYKKFPQTKQLTFLFFDIEQYMKPGTMFPDFNDRITSISYCTNDRVVKTIFLKKETESDKKLLEEFIKRFVAIDPDIIVVYNKNYDVPTLMNRCIRNHIDITSFSRGTEKPQFGKHMDIPGRLVYDVLISAQADQTLTGNVMNKGLKEVSGFFKFKSEYKVLTPKEIADGVGTDELINYNKDDVRRLCLLFDVYWPNIEFNANDLGIPLDVAVELSITDLALVTLGDEHRQLGIISDGDNSTRYPQIFQRKKRPEEPNYQGALIGIAKTGVFKPIYKADYGSMYPSIMASFNLSPDTTTLLMLSPYDGIFKIKEEPYWYIYEIPDDVLNCNMVIQVLKKDGYSAKLVWKYISERSEFKKLSKATGEKKYESMSSNRKVKANGTYGIMGSPKHAFGFAPIAIATTGIGRESVQMLMDILNELYPNSVIEWDTDGIYFATDKFNKDDVLILFEQRLKEKFKKDLKLTVDFDEYNAGFFYLAKNYILKKKDKTIYHGVAMKASSQDLLSKSLIKELAEAKFAEQPVDDIIRKYQKLDFPLNFFAMNISLGMSMNQYKNVNALAPRLAREAKEKLKITPVVGQQYYYIKSSNGYMLYDLASINDVDKDYYRQEVNDIIEMFHEHPITKSIDAWL